MSERSHSSGNPEAIEEHAMQDVDPKARQTPVRHVVAVLALSAGAGCGLVWTGSQPDRHPVIFALVLSWFIAVFVGAITHQMFLRLDPKRFRFARWERNGRVYEWVGLGVFRWVLLHTPLRWLSAQVPLKSGRSDLDRLLRDLNPPEGLHAIAAGVSLAVAAVYALTGHTAISAWLVLITIPFNVYPVILQRWVRGRILRLQRRLDAVKQSSGEPRRHLIDDRG
ncbi:MAG: hypothetical protein HZA88_24245 [Verrucomicrobia bacterium]|nr:hypothetical protein [Verrucomicrobiota bacterium]